MEELIFIKFGGSVITDKNKPFTSKERVIRRLGKEIISAQSKYKGRVIIGHGSGSFGHTLASRYSTHEGKINRKSIRGAVLVEDVVVELNKIVVKNLLKVGLPVFSFSPASFLLSKGYSQANLFLDSLCEALRNGVIPIVYGDVIFDIKQGFAIYSTEKVFEAIIKKLHKKYKILKVIQIGDTNGVYNEKGRTIVKITPTSYKKQKDSIQKSPTIDVTGGMSHKVLASLELAKRFGIQSLIINGNKQGALTKSVLENRVVGTSLIS